MATERPPVELVEDVEELLELLEAIVEPIAERIQPAAEEALGLILAYVAPVELNFRKSLADQIAALPGAAKSK